MELPAMSQRLILAGQSLTRYGAAVILLWAGAVKFIPCEAEGIKPLIANSPLTSWVYGVMSVGTFSAVLGVIEIAIGLLIALRPLWPMVSAIGSLLAVGIILTTLTFLFSTPRREPRLGEFPAIALPGRFVLKDVVLLGAALSSAGEALVASELHDNDRNRIKPA
jgi:reactive chlorine resistance protein C